MKTCPTCGQQVPQTILTSPERVLEILAHRQNGSRRDVYMGSDGNWYITHGGGQVDTQLLRQMVSDGKLVRTYDVCDDSFTIGKTMDTQATVKARKRHELRKGEVIYTDGSRGP